MQDLAMAPPVEGFQLSDTQTSSRGAKTCTLLSGKGEKIVFTLGPTSTPFGATNFQDEASSRKTLDLRVSESEYEFFKELDNWAIDYITKNSERLFKKSLTRAQVLEHYRSPVTTKEGYQPLVRTKINTLGQNACRCWSSQREPTTLPEDLRGCSFLSHVHLSHLWVMGRDFGFVICCQDLQILEQTNHECPFD